MDFLYSLLSLAVWWAPLLILIYAALASDFFRTSWRRVKTTYKQLSVLRGLVSTRHKNPVRAIAVTAFTALKTCGTMIFKTCWINFLQYLNNSVAREGRFYCVTYSIKGRLYKIRVVPPRGPEKILQIIDDAYKDVTDEIGPYLRAQQSMIHHFTPKSFNAENIQILTSDEDDPYNFNEGERIVLRNEEEKLAPLSDPSLGSSAPEMPEPLHNLLGGVMSMIDSFQQEARQKAAAPKAD